MYESREEYATIVHRRLIALEWAMGRPIVHGDSGTCPRCDSFGTFDIDGLGFTQGVANSIYYSTVFNEWRCRRCDFRMCH